MFLLYLPDSRNIYTRQRSGYLEGSDLPILGALLPDVLQNILVLLLVPQLLLRHHVQETEDLRGQPRPGHALHAGDLYAGGQHVHADHVLGSDTGSLDDQFLVSQLHTIETSDGLVGDGSIKILGERIAFG